MGHVFLKREVSKGEINSLVVLKTPIPFLLAGKINSKSSKQFSDFDIRAG